MMSPHTYLAQWGFASSDGNGYRKDLYTALQGAGATVDFVGTVKSGNMADNDNEGYPGYTIDQIDSATRNAINAGLKPDVILLHAGTNDLNGNVDVSNAGTRLKKLISDVNAAWPQATVLVAQIIGSTNAGLHTKINSYNAQIPGTQSIMLASVLTNADDKVQVSSKDLRLRARRWRSWISRASRSLL